LGVDCLPHNLPASSLPSYWKLCRHFGLVQPRNAPFGGGLISQINDAVRSSSFDCVVLVRVATPTLVRQKADNRPVFVTRLVAETIRYFSASAQYSDSRSTPLRSSHASHATLLVAIVSVNRQYCLRRSSSAASISSSFS
jgi:hypothetical protein